MRMIEFGPDGGREMTRFDSRGLRAVGLVWDEAFSVNVLHVAAGGLVGLHPAVGEQLLLVVSGRGEVRGDDGSWQPIAAGQAALWSPGEEHSTRAHEPLVAVVIEAPALRLAPPALRLIR